MSAATREDSQMRDTKRNEEERGVKESPQSSNEGFGEPQGNNSATKVISAFEITFIGLGRKGIDGKLEFRFLWLLLIFSVAVISSHVS